MPLEVFFSDEKSGIWICAVLDDPIKTLLWEQQQLQGFGWYGFSNKFSVAGVEHHIKYTGLCSREKNLLVPSGKMAEILIEQPRIMMKSVAEFQGKADASQELFLCE